MAKLSATFFILFFFLNISQAASTHRQDKTVYDITNGQQKKFPRDQEQVCESAFENEAEEFSSLQKKIIIPTAYASRYTAEDWLLHTTAAPLTEERSNAHPVSYRKRFLDICILRL